MQALNRGHLAQSAQDDQLESVIESYELAFRMQTEAPELTDLTKESPEPLSMYGVDQTPTDNFARQCLLARRFAEKGVRFIQVNHAFKWDSHQNIKDEHARVVLVAVTLNIFPWNMNECECAIKQVFDPADQFAFVAENFG